MTDVPKFQKYKVPEIRMNNVPQEERKYDWSDKRKEIRSEKMKWELWSENYELV